MVSNQTDKRQAVSKNTGAKILTATLLAILLAALVLVVYYFVKWVRDENTNVAKNITITEDEASTSQNSASKIPAETGIEIKKIDLQPLVDDWVSNVSGNKSVLIYDLDRDEIVGEYNVTEKYNTASLYKLFVVYEGYRKLENGEWQTEDPADGTGHTILECLDLAIRESNSECAEILWRMIGHDKLENIATKDFEMKNTSVKNLVSDPTDIMKMMKIFYEHPDVKNEDLLARLRDSFLNQPKTAYNWRQGLPSGFSDKVNVYNKVGWEYNAEKSYWNIYHDAAIVEFPDKNRHFIVVVMTNKVPYQKIRELGTEIEKTFYNNQ